MYVVSWPSHLYAREKQSGNIVHNKLSQTLKCGATNQITSFVIKMYYKREFFRSHSLRQTLKIYFIKAWAETIKIIILQAINGY